MANSYKVPQDVEAEDKLIGPFSFRQFIYLGIVAMALAACWGLFLLFPFLAIIPLPIVVFFGLLALPLRKDQPMETYLAAMWQFYIKPRRRMWMADGVVSRITIDIPLVIERQLIKNITGDQALSQFDYLAQVADTGGWSTRGVTQAPMTVVDNPEEDILDDSSIVARQFDTRLQHDDDQRREELLARVHSGSIVDEAPAQPWATSMVAPQSAPQDTPIVAMPDYSAHHDEPTDFTYEEPAPVFNPSPKYMQQHVLQPLDPNHAALTPEPRTSQPQPTLPKIEQNAPEPSASVATPAIMDLAKDVSIETVAKQLHHEGVERHGDEVVINLH